jgi:hypothetical protein
LLPTPTELESTWLLVQVETFLTEIYYSKSHLEKAKAAFLTEKMSTKMYTVGLIASQKSVDDWAAPNFL